MDRQYYLRRYEEELERASNASSAEARIAHEELAERFRQAAEQPDPPAAADGQGWELSPQTA